MTDPLDTADEFHASILSSDRWSVTVGLLIGVVFTTPLFLTIF